MTIQNMEVVMLTRIFCDVDDFCQTFEPEFQQFLLEAECKRQMTSCRLSLFHGELTNAILENG